MPCGPYHLIRSRSSVRTVAAAPSGWLPSPSASPPRHFVDHLAGAGALSRRTRHGDARASRARSPKRLVADATASRSAAPDRPPSFPLPRRGPSPPAQPRAAAVPRCPRAPFLSTRCLLPIRELGLTFGRLLVPFELGPWGQAAGSVPLLARLRLLGNRIALLVCC